MDNMHLDGNIAKNAALRENVFMMAICLELKIPLFLVGKPGSSKSLAKAIISESMRGKDSRNELLKHFKEVGWFLCIQKQSYSSNALYRLGFSHISVVSSLLQRV